MSALERAELIELNEDLTDIRSGGKRVRVQFNPETLKVSFSTQTATPSRTASDGGSGGGQARTGDQAAGTAGRQYLGAWRCRCGSIARPRPNPSSKLTTYAG